MSKKIALLLLVIVLSGIVRAQEGPQPGVTISADVTAGTAPLTVNFTAAVIDPFDGIYAITYEWYFDDGAASTEKNPTHTFKPGRTYEVTCKVTFWKRPKIMVGDKVDITVIDPPAVSISANPGSGLVPLTAAFASAVTGGREGAEYTYAWNFGDTSTSSEANPTHEFTNAGTYNVICTITDTTDSSLTARGTIEINVIPLWPAAVCTAVYSQGNPQIISDGSGGAIITWQDSRSGNWDIYARRIEGTGRLMWSTDGVAICTAANNQGATQIISDGSGGAFITWQDSRSGNADIYAQRIDNTGKHLWAAGGLAICTALSDQISPQIASDGAGGAIITWGDLRSENGYDIYAQRIDSTGKHLWAADGVAICTALDSQYYPQIISDDSGGTIITWGDTRSGNNYDIYAQRIDSTGKHLWTADGVPICTAANDQWLPQITSDGSSDVIITWQDLRSGNWDIYAQRLDSTGKLLWAADGVAICTAVNEYPGPQIVSDGSGGAIIAWHDTRSGNWDIYARRIDKEGNPLWTANGVAVCTALNEQYYPQIAPDGSGGAIITWHDYRSANYDIYAQRLDSTGKHLWAADGVAISTAARDQLSPQITSDGSGGAIITWQDSRSGNSDIYAQGITKDGELK